MPNSTDVAKFMVDELNTDGYLYQENVVYDIQNDFGDDFVYYNANGGLSISKSVLKEFRKLTPNVVWERGEKCWRLKEDGEEISGRMTD